MYYLCRPSYLIKVYVSFLLKTCKKISCYIYFLFFILRLKHEYNVRTDEVSVSLPISAQ